MEIDFIYSTIFNFLINLSYTFSALVIAVVSIKIVDKTLLKKLDIEEELKNNNIAVAIFASALIVFVAIVVSVGMRG